MNAAERTSKGWDLRHPIWIGVIFALALGLRLWGLTTESFWSDEAFTVEASQGSFAEIVERNARDIHPPGYYLGLWAWRGLLSLAAPDLGDADATIRLYSLIFSLLGLGLLFVLAKDLAGRRTALVASLLLAVNPIDIYFAQEARMYAQTTALCVACTIVLWRWCDAARSSGKAARLYQYPIAYGVLASLLLLTHYVAVTFLVGQGLVAIAIFARRRYLSSLLGLLGAGVISGLLFLPWLLVVLQYRDTLIRPVGLEWMPVPTLSDYFSFIGREYFWGRVRQIHDAWWIPTLFLPLAVLASGACVSRWRRAGESRSLEGSRRDVLLLLAGSVVAPLLVIAVVCISYQVVYFRPRYVVILLPYFLIGLAMACTAWRAMRVQAALVGLLVSVMLAGVGAQHATSQKHPWRETAVHWPAATAPAFYVIFPAEHQQSLSRYLDGSIRHTPREVLERIGPLPEGALIWIANWPDPLSAKDADYRNWLEGVGDARHQLLPTYYSITQVESRIPYAPPEFAQQRFRAWYRPFDIHEQLSGFSDARSFDRLTFDTAGRPVRRSAARARVRIADAQEGESIVIRSPIERLASSPEFFVRRGDDPSTPFVRSHATVHGDFEAEDREYHLSAPAGEGALWLGWSVEASDPKERSAKTRSRPGMWIVWIGIGDAQEADRDAARTAGAAALNRANRVAAEFAL